MNENVVFWLKVAVMSITVLFGVYVTSKALLAPAQPIDYRIEGDSTIEIDLSVE